MATVNASDKTPLHISPEVEQLGRRISMHVSAGRYGQARRVLGLAIAEFSRPRAAERVTRDTALAGLDLPVRLVNVLEAAGVRTVGDANRATDRELAALEGLGPVGVRQVRNGIRAGLLVGVAHPYV
ncbi:MAG: DNA-directed RNA polymerase subunit alpha C-terminal domain-containing protein [Pirellulaceae bacterium]